MLAGSDEAGSLHVMDAVWSLLITLSADGFVCSSLPPLAGGGREEKGARFFHGNFEVQRADCRAQTGDVMLETLFPPVTSCQGSQWRGGHRYLLGATETLREEPGCGRHCVRADGHVGRLGKIFFTLSMGGKPNTHAIGEKFPAELCWQHCCTICKSHY